MTTLQLILHTTLSEWKAIAHNIPLLLVMLGGNIGYGFLYNYMYNPNTVNEAPIAVVDMAGDKLSHTFIHNLDATEQVTVAYTLTDYAMAEQLVRDRKIVGFLYIPQNFSKLGSGYNHSNIMAYGSTLSFLDFLMLQEATTYTLLDFNTMLRPMYVNQLDDKQKLALAQLQPIEVIANPMFNSNEGYGTYLIPPVLMLIIFQTLIICICISSGTEREEKQLNNKLINTSTCNKALILVIGKSMAYISIYCIISAFMLGFLPKVFSLPHISQATTIVVMMIPFLVASSLFGLCLLPICTDGEKPLIYIVFMSIILLFLSGVSYPLERMPWYWKWPHYVFPATAGTLAFVKANTMGATLPQLQPELITMSIQCIIYFIVAILIYNRALRKGYWNIG